MKAIVLVDNISDGINDGEWGLSIHIEYKDKRILLDTGASDLFVNNAEALNVDLKNVDMGVLSHAHYDHSDGMDAFFEINDHAKFYIQASCKENCYKKEALITKYIGIKKGILSQYKDRYVLVNNDMKISEGIYIVSHKTAHLDEIGRRENMVLKTENGFVYDNFSHEQSLVFRTEKGLVIFNSCCHAGAALIIKEIADYFKGEKVYALIGGFHLFNKDDEFVKELADKIRETKIEKIYTGHCTGEHAFDILKSELGESVEQLKVGLTINL